MVDHRFKPILHITLTLTTFLICLHDPEIIMCLIIVNAFLHVQANQEPCSLKVLFRDIPKNDADCNGS